MMDFVSSRMTAPPCLQKGDKVAIAVPARKITLAEVQTFVSMLTEWGLKVIFASNFGKEYHQFAGNETERVTGLQSLLDDPSIKAIFCARGGYGTVRIIDSLDFSFFIAHPKWIVGYSDITVLHSHIHNNFEIETLHSIMPIDFAVGTPSSFAVESLKKALFENETISYKFLTSPYSRTGTAEGILCGGNLSILYSLNNTISDLDTRGKILFLEDVDEYLYHIDRMMLNFKRSGKLNNLAGLIVGGMSRMNDNTIPYGKDAIDIISENIKEYHFPVCFDFPAGHITDNRTLILGCRVQLQIDEKSSVVQFL